MAEGPRGSRQPAAALGASGTSVPRPPVPQAGGPADLLPFRAPAFLRTAGGVSWESRHGADQREKVPSTTLKCGEHFASWSAPVYGVEKRHRAPSLSCVSFVFLGRNPHNCVHHLNSTLVKESYRLFKDYQRQFVQNSAIKGV